MGEPGPGNPDPDDEDEDDFADEPGWQLAARGVRLALNNRVEEAETLLRRRAGDELCEGRVQAQAGLCFLTFMVSWSGR